MNSGVTLLDFIREQQQLKGTKIECRKGDCSACTVLVGELKDNKVNYQSITSCISPLGNTNGKHIVTVEGINSLDIMKITGHKSFFSLMNYIRCENLEIVLKLSEHEFFNQKL
ncbi:2Fe-2S iron-sulfur cluster-binding protein [Polaribacter cellanae]|uniref:2Fe-2S iron-sulfur cluster-binding protein n=1 Tax=Polaribacter cellanae TaxID=2818493 RepID=UPI00349EBDA0